MFFWVVILCLVFFVQLNLKAFKKSSFFQPCPALTVFHVRYLDPGSNGSVNIVV